MRKSAFDSTHSTPLHLDLDQSGKYILKGIIHGMEATLSFADEEPARNAKEACLSIITDQYTDHAVAKNRRPA